MALWGRDDNLGSAGTVGLNYGTGVVTGSGTSFTSSDVGKIIRFGFRGSGGVYFGDGVIKERSSATSVKIAGTEGLSGVAIAGTSYYLSELPISTVGDHGWSNKHDTVASYGNWKHVTANAATSVGGANVSVEGGARHLHLDVSLTHPDVLVNGGANITVTGIGTGSVATDNPSGIGSITLYVVAPPGVKKGDTIDGAADTKGRKAKIAGIGATVVHLNHGIAAQINAGVSLVFNNDNLVSLATTVGTAIAAGDRIQFKRLSGGYDRQIYGVSTTEAAHYGGVSTKYRTENGGWVGVTTYIDCHGQLRIKKETLVTIGGDVGITTGEHGINYPTPAG